MKEHGILFSAPMVRALLAGTKTQTRRLVKAPKDFEIDAPIGLQVRCVRNHGDEGEADLEYRDISAPHGPVGRIVYVKETWAPWGEHIEERGEAETLADAKAGMPWASIVFGADANGGCVEVKRWRPSIHMPRWAARLWFRVTRVRIERVQAITEEDARAEGVGEHEVTGSAADRYSQLWDEINGAGSWASNPWVWVYDFRRVDGRGR